MTELTATPNGIHMPVMRPRIGFLGVGWIGRNRMEAMASSGLIEVAAVADASEDVANAVIEEFAPGAACASDFDSLLEEDIDGLVIATPSALHASQAAAALQAGLAVFCQKPLGRTAEENRRVVQAARKADCLLGVDLSYRHVNGMQQIRDIIAGKQIGKVFAVDLTFHNAYGPDKKWYYDIEQSGGGCLIDLGIHLVDLVLWTLDFPSVVSVSSRLYSAGEPLEGQFHRTEDFVTARLDLSNGTAVNLACSWRISAGWDAVIEATFYGTEGGLALHNLDGSFYALRTERFRGTSREILHEMDTEWGGRAAVAWARQLAQANRFDPDVEHIIEVAQALDLIYGRPRS